MSLVQWVPKMEHRFAGQLDDITEEPSCLEPISEWFGEDGYNRGRFYWLRLVMCKSPGCSNLGHSDQFRMAVLRGVDAPKPLKIEREVMDDAAAFLGWPGYRSEFSDDPSGYEVFLFPEEPVPIDRITVQYE